jgi:hypothetical protein
MCACASAGNLSHQAPTHLEQITPSISGTKNETKQRKKEKLKD